MAKIVLHAVCEKCAALCCINLAFDKSASFAFDKEAGCPCPHLDANARCSIHDNLQERGFSGCAQYDCLGAGQRVTQEVFAGRSWQQEPDLLAPMSRAFAQMRKVHENLQLLETAAALSLLPSQESARISLLEELNPSRGWTQQSLDAFERSGLQARIGEFLVSLRDRAGTGLGSE